MAGNKDSLLPSDAKVKAECRKGAQKLELRVQNSESRKQKLFFLRQKRLFYFLQSELRVLRFVWLQFDYSNPLSLAPF